MKNKYTTLALLKNEAAVEDLFVSRLIRDCGYEDESILHKSSIEPIEVALGAKRVRYAPDYILSANGRPRIVIDAKAPDENLMSWIGQCVSYCVTLNRRYDEENPLQKFVLSNGARTLVFSVDHGKPLADLSFSDFHDGNLKFERLKTLLNPSYQNSEQVDEQQAHEFRRLDLEEVNAVFAWCHQHIYRKDALSQAAGFEEFVKLVFLKLLSDRQVRDKHPTKIEANRFLIPNDDVRFSRRWIEDRETDDSNPLDALQFQSLLRDLERQIRRNERKRIFKENARINLHPGTIKEVVRRLENVYLFGIDADLNGRLFETFLSATMRGKDLGQFFTPRSVAKLGTLLASPRITKDYHEVVLDGCCGTGGFLIDVLAHMWQRVDDNPTLSSTDRLELRRIVAEQAIYGVDNAQEPNLARLARMNMYLHGDGGTSIFEADFLDKRMTDPMQASSEVRAEVSQLRVLLESAPAGFADVILTNPPFAKVYEKKVDRDRRILDDYELAVDRKSLKSSLMFFERYHDLLKVGGRLVSVIDDGILSGTSYKAFRSYLLSHFLLKAVVSLPGDAFQRSQARVKTSIIILEKRDASTAQAQGPIFRYACRFVGIDDPKRQRTLPIDLVNRRLAKEEIAEVSRLYEDFKAGKSVPKEHIVAADLLTDRIDAKNFEQTGTLVSTWHSREITTAKIRELVAPVELSSLADASDESGGGEATYLVVGYDGFAREGETFRVPDSAANLFVVRPNQIVVSHINAVNGSICVVPDHLDGLVVTNEFTALEAAPKYDPRVIWAILRSPEIRSEFLIRASGAGRTRVRWTTLADIRVPLPTDELAQSVVSDLLQVEEELRTAYQMRHDTQRRLQETLLLSSERASAMLQAYKPPR